VTTDHHDEREPFDRAAQTEPGEYREQVGTIFEVEHSDGAIPLRLASVSDERISHDFVQFSLFFHGPPARLLSQGIYYFGHATLGRLALFIVPILGSNHERIVYEACFNRRVATRSQPAAGGNE
jgi:hypothetical protein